MPLAFRLSEGLGRTGEGPLKLLHFMPLILAVLERVGESRRGTPGLPRVLRLRMAFCGLLGRSRK